MKKNSATQTKYLWASAALPCVAGAEHAMKGEPCVNITGVSSFSQRQRLEDENVDVAASHMANTSTC